MKKLDRGTFPSGHNINDFKCFGPPATKDGEFDGTNITDMGCFTQDNKSTNKYYHAAVVESKVNNIWYVYLEWGRVGSTPDFQFYECGSQSEAQSEYVKQLHSKNDKRGEWVTHSVLGRILQAKANKDCYLVRPQATRSTGLPDAKTISGVEKKVAVVSKSISTKKLHPEVESLLKDINSGTIEYARTSMATSSIPTLDAINEARLILAEAVKSKKEKELNDLTKMLYSRIPKRVSVGEKITLSSDNISSWLSDLDAFEGAIDNVENETQVLDLPFELEFIEHNSVIGKMIHNMYEKGTRNRHGYLGKINIKKIWSIKHKYSDCMIKPQKEIAEKKISFKEGPFWKIERVDLDSTDKKLYNESNTHLMFHGTRSCNVSPILKSRLRLPAQLTGVSITGSMFGAGIYFADDWKKSAGYTSLSGSYWSSGNGKIKNREAFMFLTDAVLGQCYIAPRASGYKGPPNGYHSIFGKADVSGVQNNEFIVFDISQNSLRYLVEFSC